VRLRAVTWDLDLHARIGQAGCNHGRGRAHGSQVFPQMGQQSGKRAASGRMYMTRTTSAKSALAFHESSLNIPQTLVGLVEQIVRDGHGLVVESGGAGHEYPISVHDGAGIADVTFELGSGTDQSPVMWVFLGRSVVGNKNRLQALPAGSRCATSVETTTQVLVESVGEQSVDEGFEVCDAGNLCLCNEAVVTGYPSQDVISGMAVNRSATRFNSPGIDVCAELQPGGARSHPG